MEAKLTNPNSVEELLNPLIYEDSSEYNLDEIKVSCSSMRLLYKTITLIEHRIQKVIMITPNLYF